MSNEIEVKLVIDSEQLNAKFDTPEFGHAVEEVFHNRSSFVADLKGMMDVPDVDDLKYDIINSYDLENAIDAQVENWIGNSDLYYLPDTVSDLQHTVEEYDFDQMQDDLNRDEEAIDDLKDRVGTLEEEAGLDWRTEFGDRLDTIEDKLGTDWSEEDNREISRLQERVDKLEEINKRLFHIIHNVQGVPLT